MIELHVVLTHLHGVLKTMGGRGRKKRGRRTKDDTSRFIYLWSMWLSQTCPSAQLPSAEDWRAMFMPHSQASDADGKLLSSKAGLEFLDTWSKKVHPDPHSKKEELSTGGKKAMLQQAQATMDDYLAAE